jgi:hypothetical protein
LLDRRAKVAWLDVILDHPKGLQGGMDGGRLDETKAASTQLGWQRLRLRSGGRHLGEVSR